MSSVAGVASSDVRSEPFHLTGVKILVGDGTVIDEGDLLVENGRISHVGEPIAARSDIPATPGRGLVIMPTLIESHGHLGYIEDGVVAREHFTREHVISQLAELARAGVSVFQSLGSDRDDIEIGIRDDQRAGRLAPTLTTLRTAGVGFVARTPGEENGGAAFAADQIHEVTDARQAGLIAREYLARVRPDLVKVWLDPRGGTKAVMDDASLRALTDAARDAGIPVLAHVYLLADAKRALRCGVAGIAHLVREPAIDDELIELFRTQGAVAMTSLGTELSLADSPDWLRAPWVAEMSGHAAVTNSYAELSAYSRDELVGYARTYPLLEDQVRTYRARGITVVMSGDTGAYGQLLGPAEHRELEAIVAAGIAPLDAISMATSIPARVFGLEDRGVLLPGRRADVLVLGSDPLENIAHTHDIRDVYLAGHRVER